MTANQLEDFVLEEHLEQAPVWEAEERQGILQRSTDIIHELQNLTMGRSEEGVCHQREEMQREVDMEGTRTDLDTLQDFIKNGFNEPKFVF